jgi:Tol biopolymer transport system component
MRFFLFGFLLASCATMEKRPASVAGDDPNAAEAADVVTRGDPPAARFADARTLLWQPGVKNAYPRWSNDGRRILFQSNRSGKWQLYVMNADGTNSHAITRGDANNDFPDWSPDNESVAFVSDRDGNEEVYVMRLDGSALRNLSNDAARDIHPCWSPDGTALLFNSTRDVDRLQTYEVRADGTGLHRLVSSPDDDSCARISPDGASFIYLANLAEGRDDVVMRRRDGTDPVNLTDDRAPDGWPTWSPDGHRIVYSSARSGTFCLYVMNADGTAPRQLTFAERPYADARACVSRDGRAIVFNRDEGETIGICVLDLSSTGEFRPAGARGRLPDSSAPASS